MDFRELDMWPKFPERKQRIEFNPEQLVTLWFLLAQSCEAYDHLAQDNPGDSNLARLSDLAWELEGLICDRLQWENRATAAERGVGVVDPDGDQRPPHTH